jgi:hypothetical protein
MIKQKPKIKQSALVDHGSNEKPAAAIMLVEVKLKR